MSTKKFLIIIGGPTASGKTSYAIRLAQKFNSEIISADSRQFYRQMNIGTAKPTSEELKQAAHHFINSLDISQDYSAGDFERDALKLLKKLYEKKDVVILAGGSGLYIKALCEGFDHFPDVPKTIKEAVEELFRDKGISALQQELQALDPAYYKTVDLHNHHRLIRAVSVCHASGKPFSFFLNQEKPERPFTSIYIILKLPRDILYDRINQRVDKMFESGLVKEAEQLYPFKTLNALQTVGYSELFEHFDGKISLEEARELIKRNSRRYAKRQLTWWRNSGLGKPFHPDEWEESLEYIGGVMK